MDNEIVALTPKSISRPISDVNLTRHLLQDKECVQLSHCSRFHPITLPEDFLSESLNKINGFNALQYYNGIYDAAGYAFYLLSHKF